MVKKYDRSFLLGADLSADMPMGRRAKAKARRAQRTQEELPAEKRPRTQQAWVAEERKRTALPKQEAAADEARGGAKVGTKKKVDPSEGVGRKKAKKLQVAAAKKARQEDKKVRSERKATQAAAEAVSSKVKKSDVSPTAAALLARCGAGAVAQQQLL